MADYPEIAHLPVGRTTVTASTYYDRDEEEHLTAVLEAIVDERVRQDQQWGGWEADDTRAPEDWEGFILYQMSGCFQTEECPPAQYRERLVKVAALAVAAIQSHDRRVAATAEDGAEADA